MNKVVYTVGYEAPAKNHKTASFKETKKGTILKTEYEPIPDEVAEKAREYLINFRRKKG
jgi:hypothetical protein